MADDDVFLRATVGMIAHVLNELVATVGALSTAISDDELRAELSEGLEELHALAARIAKAFPPPTQNGWPPRS